MKTLILFIVLFLNVRVNAQIADYKLKAENFKSNSEHQIQFDINLLHQHNGSNFEFLFVGGQFVFTLNQKFPSDLLITILNPIGGGNENVYIENNRLVITCHVIDHLVVSDSMLGSKMMTVQLNSDSSNMIQLLSTLRWVNPEDLNPRTLIYQYDIMHNEVIDISTSFFHFIYNNLLLISNENSDISLNIKNYPNPFNSETNFSYNLNENGFVNIIIYNIIGQEVDNLIGQYQTIGSYSIKYSNENLNSGTYYYFFEFNNRVVQKNKFIIIK